MHVKYRSLFQSAHTPPQQIQNINEIVMKFRNLGIVINTNLMLIIHKEIFHKIFDTGKIFPKIIRETFSVSRDLNVAFHVIFHANF